MHSGRRQFARSLGVSYEIDRVRTISIAKIGLGRICLSDGTFDLAKSYLGEAVSFCGKAGALPDLMEALLGVADLYILLEKLREASVILTVVANHSTTAFHTREESNAMLAAHSPAVENSADKPLSKPSQDIGALIDSVLSFLGTASHTSVPPQQFSF